MGWKKINKIQLIMLACILILSACSPGTHQLSPTPTHLAPTEDFDASPTTVKAPPPTAASTPPNKTDTTYWLAPTLPQSFVNALHIPTKWQNVSSVEDADYRIEIAPQNPSADWIYALVAPFPTIPDGVTAQDFQSAWKYGPSETFPAKKILLDQGTYDILTSQLGQPATGFIEITSGDQTLERAWADHTTWAVIPFEQIEPRWKVIAVDQQSPLRKNFNPAQYPLKVSFDIISSAHSTPLNILDKRSILPASNRLPDHLTTLIMTGTTALVRNVAAAMINHSLTYPDQFIRDTLREADFTHVSNEVAFTPSCPTPSKQDGNLTFCSKPAYIELLKDAGVDIIELDGDHLNDFGDQPIRYTLELYKQNGMSYYGGGYNQEDARKPLLLEHNGNKIALLGCNSKGIGYATATKTSPGAVHCDYLWIIEQIKQLRSQGYIPIVTLQHEEYFTTRANPRFTPDFQALADAGAVIVSGSQSHIPQALEFRGSNLIHYGLGNLFFDQFSWGIRQAFMDRHVFYDGRYIGTELLPIQFVDDARPRLASPAESQELLNTVFNASQW